jgi:hypothetical protein
VPTRLSPGAIKDKLRDVRGIAVPGMLRCERYNHME